MIDLSKYSDIRVSESCAEVTQYIKGIVTKKIQTLQAEKRHILDISYVQVGKLTYVFITHGKPTIRVL